MVDFKQPKYYVNREISWLAFNDRVLEEARDTANPLFERANFLAITQKNMTNGSWCVSLACNNKSC